MRQRWSALGVIVLILSVCGCQAGADTNFHPPSSALDVRLSGLDLSTPQPFPARITVRNLLDPDITYLVECQRKDFQLEGADFCDALIVLPPGVYEIIVQAADPRCVPEQDRYVVLVEPEKTTEISILLICSSAEALITEDGAPLIESLWLEYFCTDNPANKFVCRGPDWIGVHVEVADPGEDCEDILGLWTLVDSGGSPVSGVLVAYEDAEAERSCTGGPVGECEFRIVVRTDAPELPEPVTGWDRYELTFSPTTDLVLGPWRFVSIPFYLASCAPSP